MDISHALSEFIKENGLGGLAILMILLQYFGFLDKLRNGRSKTSTKNEGSTEDDTRPHKRKDDKEGNFYHMRTDEHSKLLAELIVRVDEHLKKEALEDIRMARLETEQVNLTKNMESENRHIFNQLGSLHEKMDSIMTLLAQRQK